MKRNNKTSDKALEYQREYYKKNAERIREQYYQQQEQIKGRKKCDTILEMLQEWNIRLTERLLDPDLESWLRWALELTRSENNRQIEKINGRTYTGNTSEKD